jgi:hypothetical protein
VICCVLANRQTRGALLKRRAKNDDRGSIEGAVEGEDRRRVEDGVADDHCQRTQNQVRAMIGEQHAKRYAHLSAAGRESGKSRRFAQSAAHIEADHYEDAAGKERDAPAPGRELLMRQQQEEQQEQPVGHQEAEGRLELREHAEPGAAMVRCILRRQERRAAPFAAQADAPAEAHDAEQDRPMTPALA